jgi:hypothetical protein
MRTAMWIGAAMVLAGMFVTAAGYLGLSVVWIAGGVAFVAFTLAIGLVVERRPA